MSNNSKNTKGGAKVVKAPLSSTAKILISVAVVVVLIVAIVVPIVVVNNNNKIDPIAGGDADAVVSNNGGLAVKQGEYLYYINAISSTTDIKSKDDNAYGNVVKGALMRAKIDSDGNISEKNILVPLMVLSSNKNGGISVFGDWVYYTTPNTALNKDDSLKVDELVFKRTNLDGTKTQDIAIAKGPATEYLYTNDALVYLAGDELKRVAYDDKKIGKESVVADKVSKVIFATNDTFDPANKVDSLVFYNKAADDKKATYNLTCVANVNTGAEPKVIIDDKSYTQDDDDSKKYSITLKDCRVVGDGTYELYYEKSDQKNPGLYGVAFNGESVDVTKEVRFSDKSLATFYPKSLNDGVYSFESNKLTLMKEVDAGDYTKYAHESIEFSNGATLLDTINYSYDDAHKDVASVLYMVNGYFYVRPLSDDAGVYAKVISNESYNVNSSWLNPEVVDNHIYFFNSSYYNYIDRVSMIDGSMLAKNRDNIDNHLSTLDAESLKKELDRITAEEKKEEENK